MTDHFTLPRNLPTGPAVETFTGKSAKLMQAVEQTRKLRKLTCQKVELLDELIESLHKLVRDEIRK